MLYGTVITARDSNDWKNTWAFVTGDSQKQAERKAMDMAKSGGSYGKFSKLEEISREKIDGALNSGKNVYGTVIGATRYGTDVSRFAIITARNQSEATGKALEMARSAMPKDLGYYKHTIGSMDLISKDKLEVASKAARLQSEITKIQTAKVKENVLSY